GVAIYQSSPATVVQYAPYALASFVAGGNTVLSNGDLRLGTSAGGTEHGFSTVTTLQGRNVVAIFPSTASAYFGGADYRTLQAGYFTELAHASLSRCALVDNGPNALLYSDQFDNAAWTKSGCSISANAATAPDGTMTADRIVENSSTSAHLVTQAITVSAT